MRVLPVWRLPAQLQDGEVVNVGLQVLPWLQINAHTHTHTRVGHHAVSCEQMARNEEHCVCVSVRVCVRA